MLLEDGRENDLQADPQLRSESERRLDDVHGRLVICPVDELHPHPSYIRHHLSVPASQLSALAKRGGVAFQEPLAITRYRTILDGYARWELARLQGRVTLPCIEYELTDAEGLHWILHRHRRSKGLSDFTRILLAQELEPWFREKARSNQRAGGQNKGSSTLTEAERLDVRCAIASVAGVSVGNVTKVKQLMMVAHSELLQALHSGEIRIHRAWLWSKTSPEKQRVELRLYRSQHGVRKTIRKLISRHRPKSSLSPLHFHLGNLVKGVSALESSELGPVGVELIDAPGKIVFLTKELYLALRSQEELALTCVTHSR